LKALAFRAVCVEYPSPMEARLRVREGNYLSVRFIFRISAVRGQPNGFSWLVKNRLTSVQLKTLNSLMCTELLALAFTDFLVLVGQERDPDKFGSFSVAVRDLFCSRPIGACLSRTVSSSAHWKLASYGVHRQ